MKLPAGLTKLAAQLHVPPAALAVGGVGGVAGLALIAKARGKSTKGTNPNPAKADTTASDLYNALQPQIEQVLEAVRAANAAAALSGIPNGGGGSFGGSPGGGIAGPGTPAPSLVTNAPSSGALVQTGTLNNQPVFTTPQGALGQFIPQVPGVSYAGYFDLVDPRTGLATITGITGDQVGAYRDIGYTPVPSGSVPVPVGEQVYGQTVTPNPPPGAFTPWGDAAQQQAQQQAMASNPGIQAGDFVYANISVPS